MSSYSRGSMVTLPGSRSSRVSRTRSRKKLRVSDYDLIAVIGKGGYGEVRVVRSKSNGTVYAMKSLLKEKMLEKSQVKHVAIERDLMVSADHPLLVHLHACFQDPSYLYFVMEYCPGGDLMKLLIKEDIFTEDVTRFYMAETAAAIGALHDMDFVHRDLKPDNILIARDGHIKLSDFGLASYNASVLEESVSHWTEELSKESSSHAKKRSSIVSPFKPSLGELKESGEDESATVTRADSSATEEESKKRGLFGFKISVFGADGKKKKHKKKKKKSGSSHSGTSVGSGSSGASGVGSEASSATATTSSETRSESKKKRKKKSGRDDYKDRRKKDRPMLFSAVGTPNYIAPEVLTKKGYGRECDWWSLGTIMFECLCGYPPFYHQTPLGTCRKILRYREFLRIPKQLQLSREAKDCIFKLICAPKKRMALAELKRHPFFRKVPFHDFRQMAPPMIPEVGDDDDTRYFEAVADVDLHEIMSPEPGSSSEDSSSEYSSEYSRTDSEAEETDMDESEEPMERKVRTRGVRGKREDLSAHKPRISSFNNLDAEGKLKAVVTDEELSSDAEDGSSRRGSTGRKRRGTKSKKSKKKTEEPKKNHFQGFTFERLDIDKKDIFADSPRLSGSSLAVPGRFPVD